MIKVDYTPHPAQCEIHKARAGSRFRTVCTGRRFGKTRCMAGELLYCGGVVAPGEYGWVAPTYGVAERGVEAFRAIADGLVRVSGRMPAKVEFDCGPGMTRVWFLSADNPDSIRGFGFKGLVVDEAASVPVDVWNYVLRPTLAQTLGWGVFIGTPAGRNWFYDMFTRGVAGEEGFKSFSFPSNASPYFPAAEWEEAKRTLPEDVFRQEYMAEFLADSAGVFRGVDGCLIQVETLNSQLSTLNAQVVVGCDLAKHTDWTVLIALDAATGRCFGMERFNRLDWPYQKERIVDFVKRLGGGLLVMDATGVGDPVYDDLRRVLPRVEPYKFTGPSKRDLVQSLMVAVEQRGVSWPAGKSMKDEGGRMNQETGGGNWEVLTAEMRRYEYEIGPSGQVSYSAPGGYHDDCVMALALAVWGAKSAARAEPGRMVRIGPRAEFRGAGARGHKDALTLA